MNKVVLSILVANLIWTGWLARSTVSTEKAETVVVHEMVQRDEKKGIQSVALSQASEVVVKTAKQAVFHWREVEAIDYQTYIVNLRAIGCPEQTIRDMIVADVHALYLRRYGVMMADEPVKFWENGYGVSSSSVEKERLIGEERETLVQLLGNAVEVPSWNGKIDSGTEDFRLSKALEGKRGAILDCKKRFSEARDIVFNNSADGILTDDELGQLQALENREQQALAEILTPEEIEEMEVRNSPLAEQLRKNLSGLDVTEDEFRALFRLKTNLEPATRALQSVEELKTVCEAYAGAVQNVLGAERFQQFIMAENSEQESDIGQNESDRAAQ